MCGHPGQPAPGVHGRRCPDGPPQVHPACLRAAPQAQEAQPAAAVAARRIIGDRDVLRRDTNSFQASSSAGHGQEETVQP